jgi:hypothetical protein
MFGYVLIFQPWIGGPIEESMDLVHHAAKGMPAYLPLQAIPIELRYISHLMSKITLTFLLHDLHLNTIGCLHLSSIL